MQNFHLKELRLTVLSIVPDRPVRGQWEYPRDNITTFFDWTGPTERNGSHYFSLLSRNLKSTEEIRATNRFVKMDRQISVRPVKVAGPPPEDGWFRVFQSEQTETDLSIWLPTEITGMFGIMESAVNDVRSSSLRSPMLLISSTVSLGSFLSRSTGWRRTVKALPHMPADTLVMLT